MSDRRLLTRAKDFAKEIVAITKEIRLKYKDVVLTNQLLRSGTSIGANVYESTYAQSKLDFVSKLEIALKECHETEYWLDLLYETGYMDEAKYKTIRNECGALRRMLISSCTTAKKNIEE